MGIIKAIISVLIPGVGTLFRRKVFLGACAVIMWVALVEAFVALAVIRPADIRPCVSPTLLAGLIAVFALNLLTEGLNLSRAGRKTKADQAFRDALSSFIAGENEKAEAILGEIERFDPLDADCLFLRAQIAAAGGDAKRAGRLFRKCRDFDEKGKWIWEIRQATGKR